VRELKYDREEVREKYKDLFEYSLDMIYVNDFNGNFLDANDVALNALGYKREEISRLNFTDLVEKEDLMKAILATKEIKEKGRHEGRMEYKIKKKDGNYMYVETYAIPLKKNGKIHAILGIGNDVTERKVIVQKLKESEENFRNISEQSLMGICILQDNIIKYVNKVVADITGYSIEEMLNWKSMDFLKLIHPSDQKRVIEQVLKKQRGDGDVLPHYQFRGINRTGEIIWIENFSKTIIYEGKPADLLTMIDISEQKRAESNLIESERKYRYLFENTPLSVIIIDSKGVIVDCNPTTESLFGYKNEDLVGKNFSNLSIVHPKYLPLLVDLFKKFFKGERIHRKEVEIYKKDKSLAWVNIQSSLLNIGEETVMEVLLNDISEKKKAEFLIEEEIKKLKELDTIRKNLIIRVSHELKTPLASISGGTELLSMQLKNEVTEEDIEILKLIEKGSERLKKLVDKLLDMSRLEYDKLELDKQEANLSEVVKECCNEIKHLMIERGLTLNIITPEVLYLEIDVIRIEQVILNLLSNAIKNTPPNGKITVSLKKMKKYAKLIVKDTGVGFITQEINKLFTRFGKFERMEKGLEYLDIQGSGLGLFISREIIDLHGGRIWVESRGRYEGSKFIVKLPIVCSNNQFKMK